MINYIKSENYRLLRKKSLYITTVICFLLITAAAIVLYLSEQHDPNFPYGTSSFLYSSVLGSVILILMVAFIFNVALTGKDSSLIKQSISFGVSRSTIFFTKLMLTVSYFLVICLIGIVLMIGLGESLLVTEEEVVRHFIIASFNMLPLVLSGFMIIHSLKMLKVSDVYILILLFFIFVFSGDLLRMIPESTSGLGELYAYTPSILLSENLMSFMNQTTQLDYHSWFVGIVLSVIFLIIGSREFAKQHID